MSLEDTPTSPDLPNRTPEVGATNGAAPAVSPAPANAPASHPDADESFKQTFLSLIVAFVVALVFRAYVVEPFVIPTGSMSPTLLGKHKQYICDQCGYEFDVNYESNDRPVNVYCPMCENPLASPTQFMSAGDRIFVHKYIYNLSEPKRWDVVVFKYPGDRETNYIKRLIGLPGEQVFIIDGNIYTQSDGTWRIARKTDRPAVQRAMWVPIYHSRFIPLDEGKPQNNPKRYDHEPWQVPWFADYPSDAWQIENRRSYRHNSAERGRIFFDFQEAANPDVPVWYAWNQFARSYVEPEPIEDVRLATRFEADAPGPGMSIRLETTSRLDNLADASAQHFLTAIMTADGKVTLERSTFDREHREVIQSAQVAAVKPGKTRAIELWYVDQEASVWVDGKRVLVYQFDLPSIEDARDRPPPQNYPMVSITVEGSPVTLYDVELDRDLYYVGSQRSQIARAGYVKDDGWTAGEPFELRADEFFCMGDNSPRSEDGRYWDSLDPWVRDLAFNGEDRYGVVPRKLLMGRAFFVYFPAPYALTYKGQPWVPNFGQMRFIH